MRVLLVSNPKTVKGFDFFIRVPNLGLTSIASNIDKDLCEVKIADLQTTGKAYLKVYQKILKDYKPDLVGISSMVFQSDKTLEIARLTRTLNKQIIIVLGGYYATTNYETIITSENGKYFDFIIKGEGEKSFNELIRQLQGKRDFSQVSGLSFYDGNSPVHIPVNGLVNLEDIKLPDRSLRLLTRGFHLMGRKADSVETSRGCVNDCNFCTVTKMYGKSYRKFKVERIIRDLWNAKKHGAEAIMFTDDNITLDGKRFAKLLQAIIDEKLNLKYAIQAGIKGLKATPGLIDLMRKAGVQVAQLGIENISGQILSQMDKSNQFDHDDATEVIKELKSNDILILGAFVFGYPDDDEETMWRNYRFARDLKIDLTLFNLLTPYPGTEIREKLLQLGLITNVDEYSRYNCYQSNIKTNFLSSDKLFQIRNKMDILYALESGTYWQLIKKEPRFMAAMIAKRIIVESELISEFIKMIRTQKIRKIKEDLP